jgi:hypothetical protein
MMEAARTSETLVNFYPTTQHYNPEDSHLCTHHRENLNSYHIVAWILSAIQQRHWTHFVPKLHKKLGFLCIHGTRDYVPSAHFWLNHWRSAKSTSLNEDFFILLQLEGPAPLSQSLTNYINFILLFLMSHMVCICLICMANFVTDSPFSNFSIILKFCFTLIQFSCFLAILLVLRIHKC